MTGINGCGIRKINRAATWQKQNECVPSEDSDQPGHPPSLIRVFAVRSMDSWGPKVSSWWQRRLWSDWADAQADPSLRSMGSWGPKVSSWWHRRLWSDWADAQADPSLRWTDSHFVGFVMSRFNNLNGSCRCLTIDAMYICIKYRILCCCGPDAIIFLIYASSSHKRVKTMHLKNKTKTIDTFIPIFKLYQKYISHLRNISLYLFTGASN